MPDVTPSNMIADIGRWQELFGLEWLWEIPLVLLVAAVAMLLLRKFHRYRTLQKQGESPISQNGQNSPASRLATSSLRTALLSCRRTLLSVAIFSGIINLLMLTGSIFMMEIYDRVLPSRSIPTLIGLGAIAALLFSFQGILDFIRGRVLARLAGHLEETLGDQVFETVTRLPLTYGAKGDLVEPMRDLDTIRSYIASNGAVVLFDLPWLPFYLVVIYMFHPLLGLFSLAGAVVLIIITLMTEYMTRSPAREANAFGTARAQLSEAARRNAEVVAAMGMRNALAGRWQKTNRAYQQYQRSAGDIAGSFGSLSKSLRFMMQSAVLGLGAWLVIQGQASAGVIIAGSILFGRALAPVDAAIASARHFVNARQSWIRLGALLEKFPFAGDKMALRAPVENITVTGLTIAPPGNQKAVVHDVSFCLRAGTALGIVGPSGSGKSCLMRGLVGAWQPMRGKVQMDGASLDQWSQEAIGRHVGYLPQDVELFAGTIAENIARFNSDANPGDIIDAAKAADVHNLILSFADGYKTVIGEQGATLSAGQRQRIGLARALFRNPFFIVMDEPNSNLDSIGERALQQAIIGVKERGGVVVLVAHRKEILSTVDYVLVMQDGRARPANAEDMELEIQPFPQRALSNKKLRIASSREGRNSTREISLRDVIRHSIEAENKVLGQNFKLVLDEEDKAKSETVSDEAETTAPVNETEKPAQVKGS